MTVIVEVRVPALEFELGRVLRMEDSSSIELEQLVPSGGASVPLFWIHDEQRAAFLETVERHPTVDDLGVIDDFDEHALVTMEWDIHRDHLFEAIAANDGQILRAVGGPETWKFELRFPSRESLADFSTDCEDAQIPFEVIRVYNPVEPRTSRWYGLTEPQLEAITLAVERGYYDIPRRCTTKELAEELGISDQAVTERLRRAIVTLVSNAILRGGGLIAERRRGPSCPGFGPTGAATEGLIDGSSRANGTSRDPTIVHQADN